MDKHSKTFKLLIRRCCRLSEVTRLNCFCSFFLFSGSLLMIEHDKFARQYVQTGLDAAFRKFVACSVDLVYSTALRPSNPNSDGSVGCFFLKLFAALTPLVALILIGRVGGVKHFRPQLIHFFGVEATIRVNGLIELFEGHINRRALRFGQWTTINNWFERSRSFSVISGLQTGGRRGDRLLEGGFRSLKRLLQRLGGVHACLLIAATRHGEHQNQ